MSKKSRDKGLRTERAFVNRLCECGVAAERVPLSGAAHGSFAGDIQLHIMGSDRRFEVKCRAAGFKQIYGWLEGNAGLFLKADRQEELVVLRLTDFIELVRNAGNDNGKSDSEHR